ncbi:Fanconi anemia group M protein, partial [Orchesella cincta]
LNAATELPGFDPSLGSIWIYPTNRSVRDYQFNIVQTALFHNTLVSLPTGLGKTFISAVVMYNFQRWYPRGLVVFMAPTRPLVTQQLDACHNTVGISPTKTIELTGHINPIKREKLWQEKTVFFLTPQVLLSDLERGYFRAEDLRLIVVDEAHKATGNHAYAQVISKVSESSRLFRVLALSATPGSDLDAVQQVFRNLLISRIELRTETSLDVLPYIHDKAVEKKVVNLGNSYLKSTYDQIVTVFQTYSGKLLKAGALTGRDGYSYTHFQLLTARETFRKGLALKLPSYQKGFIENDFAICMSLAHAMEILLSHGLRTFFIYLQGVLNKEKGSAMVTAELKKNTQLQVLLDEIKEKLNISVANSTFEMDLTNKPGIFDEVSFSETRRNMGKDIDYTLSHPKLAILKDIVSNHFLAYAAKNESTRVMIFSQVYPYKSSVVYRDSVQEIGNMLNSLRPMVKPIVFIGQSSTGTTGKGLKQKDQVQVVQQFREGGFNVLVSTCVGEEGLDIGEVDLIVCFDASSSPTRLMQRMGRTGRQREGKAIFLVTQGKEEEKYRRSFNQHSSISKSITDPQRLEPYLYKFSPRMVPVG